MSTLRSLKALEKKQSEDEKNKGYSGLLNMIKKSQPVKQLKKAYIWTKSSMWKLTKKGGRYLWVVATCLLVTFIPLYFEVEREQMVLEMEKIQIEHLKAQGYTSVQLANLGLMEESMLKTNES